MEKIWLVGSREPNGITWLANCLLCLGYKTYRSTPRVPEGMWVRKGDVHVLHPQEDKLRKWLPVLSSQEKFIFHPDIEFEWTHSWPSNAILGRRIVFFVRDARDTLFSRYKRERLLLSFEDWLQLIEPTTLLDRPSNWGFFNHSWLDFADDNFHILRFEDYKANSVATLKMACEFCGIEIDEQSLDRAIAASTSEKVMETETRYLGENANDRNKINRGGQVGQWGKSADYTEHALHLINEITFPIQAKLGYATSPSAAVPPIPAYLPSKWFLDQVGIFRNMPLHPETQALCERQDSRRLELNVFRHMLEFDRLPELVRRNAFYYGYGDINQYLSSLTAFGNGFNTRLSRQIQGALQGMSAR